MRERRVVIGTDSGGGGIKPPCVPLERRDRSVDAVLFDQFLDWRWPAVKWDREKYYSGELFSANPMEMLPAAIAILATCDGNVNRSIIDGVNYVAIAMPSR